MTGNDNGNTVITVGPGYSTTDYQGEDGTMAFVYAWESEMQDVGVAEQEITDIVEGEKIETELRFKEPFVSTDQSYMITENITKGQTKVTFEYNGKMNYPTNLLILALPCSPSFY